MTIWQFLIILININAILASVLVIFWARNMKREATSTIAKNTDIWTAVQNQPYISKRFALKNYMGWTDKDIDDHLGSN